MLFYRGVKVGFKGLGFGPNRFTNITFVEVCTWGIFYISHAKEAKLKTHISDIITIYVYTDVIIILYYYHNIGSTLTNGLAHNRSEIRSEITKQSAFG